MKILHVITSLQTGGAETLVVNLIPRLEAMGHELGLVVFNGERTPLRIMDKWMYRRYDKVISYI